MARNDRLSLFILILYIIIGPQPCFTSNEVLEDVMRSGRPLSPSELNEYLTKLTQHKSWQKSKQTYGYAVKLPQFKILRIIPQEFIILASPTHDLPIAASFEDNCLAGSLPLRDFFHTILTDTSLKDIPLRLFIPIAQANYRWLIGKRSHWTHLESYRNAAGEWHHTHIDSKSSLGWYGNYDLDNIRLSVPGQSLESIYNGDQGLFDTTSCPKFVYRYIQSRLIEVTQNCLTQRKITPSPSLQ